MNGAANEQKTLALEELKAEQSRLTALIKITKDARIAALRKELDELLNDPANIGEGEIPMRRRSGVPDKRVSRRLYTLKETALSWG